MSCYAYSNTGNNCCPPCSCETNCTPTLNPRYCCRPDPFECGETYCCGDFVSCKGNIYVVVKNCPHGCPGTSCDFVQVTMEPEGPTPRQNNCCDCY